MQDFVATDWLLDMSRRYEADGWRYEKTASTIAEQAAEIERLRAHLAKVETLPAFGITLGEQAAEIERLRYALYGKTKTEREATSPLPEQP